MRSALIIITAMLGALALCLLLFWPAEDQAAEEEDALPIYTGGVEAGEDEIAPDAFGPGPSVCSMDPRYRPRPGAEQTCPVIP